MSDVSPLVYNVKFIHISHRDSVSEGDPLQGVAVCNPMLHELLPQGRRDAGRAAVRADLGAGQALGQLAVRLGARPGPGPGEDRRRLPEEESPRRASSIPQRQHGRKLRHLPLSDGWMDG